MYLLSEVGHDFPSSSPNFHCGAQIVYQVSSVEVDLQSLLP
jgi:hypothetical protein